MGLRVVALVSSLCLIGAYVAYRVWAAPPADGPSGVEARFGGSKSAAIVEPGEAAPPPATAEPSTQEHFVGSKSARIFDAPPGPVPPAKPPEEESELGPVGPGR